MTSDGWHEKLRLTTRRQKSGEGRRVGGEERGGGNINMSEGRGADKGMPSSSRFM